MSNGTAVALVERVVGRKRAQVESRSMPQLISRPLRGSLGANGRKEDRCLRAPDFSTSAWARVEGRLLMKPRIEGRSRFYDWSISATYGRILTGVVGVRSWCPRQGAPSGGTLPCLSLFMAG